MKRTGSGKELGDYESRTDGDSDKELLCSKSLSQTMHRNLGQLIVKSMRNLLGVFRGLYRIKLA